MTRHDIKEVRTPTHIVVKCTCGWRQHVNRRQDTALRGAKVRALIAGHIRGVKP